MRIAVSFLIQKFLFLLPVSRFFKIRRRLLQLIGYTIGQNTCVCGSSFLYGRGQFEIGPDSWISPGFRCYTTPNAKVSIGANCDIGHEVTILTGTHLIGDGARRAGQAREDNVVIGDGCWIGARTLILPGTEIGAGAVIGAGSVVTKDIPDNTLQAGVPVTFKRSL